MQFIDISVENLINVKNLVLFDYLEFKGSIPENYETHNFWEMVYVSEGTMCEASKNEKHILKKGDILFHHPNKPHSTIAINKDEVKVYFISFVCNSRAMNLFNNYQTSITEVTKPLIDNLIREAKSTFKIVHASKKTKLSQRHDAPLGGSQLYKLYLEAFLINLLREQCIGNSYKMFTKKEELFKHLCNDICEYLSDNIYSHITLNMVCTKFNYGKSLICSKFKEQYGESIINYYNKLKIFEACRLIDEKKHSISYISNILNFSDRYYFSKVFKKTIGVSPKEYQSKKLSQKPRSLTK